jgi:TetR/AcrR family transcriptional regulator, transcriptional repressor of aconitase
MLLKYLSNRHNARQACNLCQICIALAQPWRLTLSERTLTTPHMRIRLAPSERRRQIVDAAMPLFARKGFSATTTKEVAETAKVSEGLLFKYFASKTALYAAIVDICSNDDPTRFEALAKLEPSINTLAVIVHDVVAYFATLKQRSAAEQSRHQLFLHSLTDDGEFARIGLKAFGDAMLPLLRRSLERADAAGDLAEVVNPEQSFWPMALLQISVGSLALHKALGPMHPVSMEDWVRDVTSFILRGMGVKAEAVRAACAAIDLTAWPLLPAKSDSTPRIARVA